MASSFLLFSGLMLPLPEGLVQTLLGPSRNLPREYACPRGLPDPKLPHAIDLVNVIFCHALHILSPPGLTLLFRREIGRQGSQQS